MSAPVALASSPFETRRPRPGRRVTSVVFRASLVGPLCLALVLTTGCGAIFRSDETQVRTAIKAWFDSFATSNVDTIAKNACGVVAAKFRQSAAEEGLNQGANNDSGKPFSMTVDSISNIQVLGDTATASVTVHSSSKPEPRNFVATVTKENGTWKYCTQ